jgi:hypothetical protein
MANHRRRVILWAVVALTGIWGAALAGWWISNRLKVTPEKVEAYVNSVNLGQLTAADRAQALRTLADKLNRLSLEDRQRLRGDRTAYRWFDQMTEAEKAQFIEATMPTGFKQIIAAFENLPEEKRRRAIDDALKRLRTANERSPREPNAGGNRRPDQPPLSEELQAKVRTIGLKTFYSESSAQTKAELAPVLEELQRAMESGRLMHGR